MEFEEYCTKKNIDAKAFEDAEKHYYAELKAIFDQISEASFTQQKMFIVNKIRRNYQIK